MAVVSSGSGSDSASFKKISGVVKVKDVIVNPSLKELQDYGANWLTSEPEYLFDDDKGKGAIISFYFKLDTADMNQELAKSMSNTVLSHRVYIYSNPRKSNDGTKTQFINAFGQTGWGETLETVTSQYFDKTKARPAYGGEESLIAFLKAWGDIRKDDECMIETFERIFKGDYSELKTLQKAWSTHKLKVLVGLKDKGENKFVQIVYPRSFWRVYATKVRVNKVDKSFEEGLPEMLAEEYNGFKADKYSINFKVWDSEELVSVTPDAEAVNQEEDVF